jgi:hypothetical protein
VADRAKAAGSTRLHAEGDGEGWTLAFNLEQFTVAVEVRRADARRLATVAARAGRGRL